MRDRVSNGIEGKELDSEEEEDSGLIAELLEAAVVVFE